jgi:hypothetical protein
MLYDSLQYEEQVYDAVMSWVLVDSENRLVAVRGKNRILSGAKEKNVFYF